MTSSSINWGRVARVAIAAGIVGGIAIDAYLYLAAILPQHGSIVGLWQFVASALLGTVAFSSPAYALLGIAIHFVVSIAWAGGYAYLAEQRPYMSERWAISGLMYGFVVYIFMQIVLIASNHFTWPQNLLGWIVPIVGHMVFFGLPVAFTSARMTAAR